MLEPGRRTTYTRRVTKEDVLHFAEVSGDRGRHHLEEDGRGRLVAHGLLTATLPTKLGGDLNYMARRMRFEFLKPVYSGDTLTCEGTVKSVVEREKFYRVELQFQVTNQDGAVVLVGDTTGVILKSSVPGPT